MKVETKEYAHNKQQPAHALDPEFLYVELKPVFMLNIPQAFENDRYSKTIKIA